MKIRWTALATLVIFIVAAIVGGVEKRTYTNIAAEENPLEHFKVGIFWGDEEYYSRLNSSEFEERVREESSYIVKVKAVSDLQFEFYYTSQLFEIEEVYQGEGLSEGEVITIALGSLFFDEEPWQVNMGYANQKEKGKEYLVYLEKEIENPFSDYRVFLIPGFMVAPIFAYEDGQSQPTSEIGITGQTVPYTLVEDNEYFAQTQEALDALLTYKEHMMEGYN